MVNLEINKGESISTVHLKSKILKGPFNLILPCLLAPHISVLLETLPARDRI